MSKVKIRRREKINWENREDGHKESIIDVVAMVKMCTASVLLTLFRFLRAGKFLCCRFWWKFLIIYTLVIGKCGHHICYTSYAYILEYFSWNSLLFSLTFTVTGFDVLFCLPSSTVIGIGQASLVNWQSSYRNHNTNKEHSVSHTQLNNNG